VALRGCVVRYAHFPPSRMPNRRILDKLGANSDSNGRAGPEFAADWSTVLVLVGNAYRTTSTVGIAARRRRRRRRSAGST
jgi:hypothetical protein